MFNIQGWVEVRFRSWEYTKQLILVLLLIIALFSIQTTVNILLPTLHLFSPCYDPATSPDMGDKAAKSKHYYHRKRTFTFLGLSFM